MLNNTFIDRIKLLFRKDKELYLYIQEQTGYLPHHIEYYRQALMHSSAKHTGANGHAINNERLEFLGDAILDAAVGDIVFKRFPGKREGFLTSTRSKVVSRETLNAIAKAINLENWITTGKNIEHKHNSYMVGNAFEALVGALYLDHGYEACKHFLEHQIIGKYIDINKLAFKEVNFKSKMIEWGQKNRMVVEFQTIEQRKDKDGSPVFHTSIIIEGRKRGEGIGYSKKESQQVASQTTFNQLKRDPYFVDKLFL